MIWDPGTHGPPSPFYAQFFGSAYNRLFAVASRLDGVLQGQLRVTSWHRTHAENVAARGQLTSQHLLATALDVNGSRVGVGQALLAQVAHRIAPAYGVVVITSEGASVHLQALPYGVSERILGLVPWLRWTGAATVSSRVPRPIAPARPASGGSWV